MPRLAHSFLSAQHWQVFVFLVAIPWLGDFAIQKLSQASDWAAAPLGLLLTAGQFCWYWAAGTFLNTFSHPDLRMKTTAFHVCLCSPLIYFSVLLMIPAGASPSVEGSLAMAAVMFVSDFYLMSFVAKALLTAETARPVTFGDYVGAFVLIMFFPIGIWFIQPRINQLYEASLMPEPEPQPQL